MDILANELTEGGHMEEEEKRCLSRVAPDSRVIFVPTFLHTCSMRWKRIACENMDGKIILL